MKLKPCPFCGGKAVLQEDNNQGCMVECTKCLAGTRIIYNLGEDARPLVAEAWNNRTHQTGN